MSIKKTYIFKDRFNGCEMFSVAQPYQLLEGNDAVFVVQSVMIAAAGAEDVDIGCGNAFGTGGEQEEDGGSAGGAGGSGPGKVNNIIDTYGLVESPQSKKSLMEWARPYMKRLKEELEQKNPSRVEAFMKGAQQFILQDIGTHFDDWQFYLTAQMDFEASMCFAKFDDGALVPKFYFLRDSLVLSYPGSGESLTNLVPAEVAKREGYLV